MKLIPEEFLSIKEKLKSRLKKNENGCLEWTGHRMWSGYGRIFASKAGKKKNDIFLAHRVFYFLETGVQPKDLCVMHSCDNPPCCNPNHLSLGTRLDNNRDAILKGRRYKQPQFERSTKITKDVFDSVKHEYEKINLSTADLAQKYNCDQATVLRALKRNGVKLRVTRERKIDAESVNQIRKLKSEGVPTKEIAAMFDVVTRTINQIYVGTSWGHIKTPYDPPNFKGN